jgi:2'-5' RNA ligase
LLLPEPFAGRIIDARARLAEDPALGRMHDPPFVHFTLQMAEDYDWDRLAEALTSFARQQTPVPIRTVGLLTVTGPSTGITLEPYRDERLARFHADLWEVVTPFARGTVAPFYLPDRWVPHVTIKRCGPERAAFGRAMTALSDDTFLWSMQVDQLTVQHDPANNNQTRYQRLLVPLGKAPAAGPRPPETNATMLQVLEPSKDADPPIWCAQVRADDGREVEVRWTAAETVHVMSAARAPMSYFAGARCWLDDDPACAVVRNIGAVTPYPIA